ncbi:MAG TPA: hypothetical protein VK335_11030 [Bryobacteraceae bacterium]|nr:hypothetical protein [Bryobacteraceae bacterium]
MRWLPVVLFSASLATAQEQIVVANAASMIGTATAAPGSMISVELIPIFGDFETIDPTSLNVTILPNGANFAEECGIVPANTSFGQFLNPNQVIAVLPATLPLGPAQLMLYHSGLTATAQIMIVPSSLGLFPPSQAYPVLQMGSGQMQTPNQLTHPAQPGDTVTIWATGLGSATQVTVVVGGRATTSSSAGAVPGQPGVDQIQFVVPSDPTIPNDCYVAVQAQTPGATSNTIAISKTNDGSACQSTLGFTTADLATLDGGGTVGLAQLTISAEVGAPLLRQGDFSSLTGILQRLTNPSSPGFSRTESANFTPLGVNATGAAEISGTVVADDVFYDCTASPPSPSAIGEVALFGSSYDFGSKVTLQGSGGTLALTPPAPLLGGFPFLGQQTSAPVSNPSQLPPPLFTPGTWTFSGNGGTGSQATQVAAPFSVQLTIPPEIMATNFSALQTINRQQDLVVAWNPTGFGEQDAVSVTWNDEPIAIFFLPTAFSPPKGLQTAICRTPATRGQIVIPAAMLQNLTPGKTGGPPTAFVNLSVSPRSGRIQTFFLPLSMVPGASIHGLLRFSSSENWPVMVE